MAWRIALQAAILVAAVSAVAVPDSHAVHEERVEHCSAWTKRDRVRPHMKLPMRIGLAQQNLDNAHDYLMDVSQPDSPNFGQHWTAEEVIDAFKPSEDTVRVVKQWLVDAGIPNNTITHSDNKAWFAFHATTKQVESLLHTEYHEYEHRETGGVMPACERYHVPKHIQNHIDYITPGVKLMAPNVEVKHTKEDLGKRQWPHGSFNDPSEHSGGWPKGGPSWNRPTWKWHKPDWHDHHLHDKNNLSICDIEITPACVAALYQIPPASHHVDPSNSMGIFEARLQFWDQFDLDSFFTNFTHIPNGTHPIDHNINGGVAKTMNISMAGVEAMLDLELAYPIVYPQTITVWNVDDLHYQTWVNNTHTWGFNTLLDAIDGSYCTFSAYGETGNAPGIDPTYPDPAPDGYKGKLQCGVFKPTNVFSLSYAGQEADVPIAYQKRQCLEYLKLGLQGISILFASGDSGIGNYPAPGGLDGPTGCLGPNHDVFNPTWPSTCPYITSVGATKVYPGHSVFDAQPESAVYDPAGFPYPVNFSSGGGFSNIYPVPSYQKSAVATYFADHDPGLPYYSALSADAPNPVLPNVTALAGTSGGIYNRLGRGVPDVAANGDNIATYINGEFGLSGGTSASAPIFASIVNRLNEARLAVGKKSIGFLNPTLYAHPEVLNDIVNGTNKACLGIGFNAVEGWDPVTGLGTPNFPKMLELSLSLP